MKRDEPVFHVSWSAWAIPRFYVVAFAAGIFALFLLALDIPGAAAHHGVAASPGHLPASGATDTTEIHDRGAP